MPRIILVCHRVEKWLFRQAGRNRLKPVASISSYWRCPTGRNKIVDSIK
jgi:hypothetical protein